MRKFIISLAVLMVLLVAAPTISVDKHKALSDGELVERYLIEGRGKEFDKVELEPGYDGMISYIAFKEDTVTAVGSVRRSYAENVINGLIED